MDKRTNEQRDLGYRLHLAETAIHLGRQSIAGILAEEPIDEAAIAEQRAAMHQARLERNDLRNQLDSVKQAETSLPAYRW